MADTAEAQRLRDYDQEMLKSAILSLIWAVKQGQQVPISELANRLGLSDATVRRWFIGSQPDLRLSILADIAGALDVELIITARDRKTGIVYTPAGALNGGDNGTG